MQSKYIGVYTNKYKPTRDEFPYRVALKRYVNSIPRYQNVGYCKTEMAAANIYNIHALATFKKGAIINDVDPMTEETDTEMRRYFSEIPKSDELIQQALDVLKEHSDVIQVHKSEG